MKRRKKEFKLSRFIKNVLLITLLLAAVEVAVIYFFMGNNKKEAVVKSTAVQKAKTATTADTRRDTFLSVENLTGRNDLPIDTKTAPAKAPETTVTIVKNEAAAATTLQADAPVSTDTNKTLVATKPIVEKKAEKQLSQSKMQEILNSIKLEKTKANSFSNCIQIRKTSASNVTNAFKIAEFLKGKGYSISGRLTVPSNQKGISINAGESCITLTIGSI